MKIPRESLPWSVYDWRHYLAVIQRKPGALRNGAPFAEMPEAFRRFQAQLLRRLLYRQRHRIENSFSRLKDWHRFATRYDRCAHTFLSAICIAADVTC